MVAGRVLGIAVAAAVLFSHPANAADVHVLTDDGEIILREDPGVHARDRAEAPPGARPQSLAPAFGSGGGRASAAHLRERRLRSAAPRTVLGELRRLHRYGRIDDATFRERRADYKSFRAAVRRFSGRRRLDMAGVLRLVQGMAGRGRLTASRLPALWLTMERNRRWWNTGPLLASGQRVGFDGSELVWQYVYGQGLQIHPLANFGKLNALWRSRRGQPRMERLLDELMALPARRAGGLAWEYYFSFGGGRAPWVSSLAQGTGLQAIVRAAVRAGREAEILPIARHGLGIFRRRPPAGVRVAGNGGVHYLQYSFAPSLRILNGFVQSLVGLHDFASYGLDVEAQQLYLEGLASARNEVPDHDTGAWSLYSLGSSSRESDLGYHVLLRDFLVSLCDRAPEAVFCDTADRFTAYLRQAPALSLVTRRLRGGRTGTLRFDLSKISRVSVQVSRRGRTVLSTSAVLGRGRKLQSFWVPRRSGRYAVRLHATDLAGNSSALSGRIRVLAPRRR